MMRATPIALCLLFLVVLMGAAPGRAHAFCTVHRPPLGVRIRAEPLAFIGVVERIENGVAHVRVQKRIRGELESSVLVWDVWAGYTGACQDVMHSTGWFSVGDQIAVFASPRGNDPPILGEPVPEGRRPLYMGGLGGGHVFFFISGAVRMAVRSEGLLLDTSKFLEFAHGQAPLGDAVIDPKFLDVADQLDDPEFKPEPSEEAPTAEAAVPPQPLQVAGPPVVESRRRRGCAIGREPAFAWMLFSLLVMGRVRRRSPASRGAHPRWR